MPENIPIPNATIESVIQGRPDVVIVQIKPEFAFSWHAGQYLSLAAAGMVPRYYSIANAMTDTASLPEIHVRRGSAAGLSAWFISHAEKGLQVSIEGPFGDCTLIALSDDDRPLMLIAGGLGIAPMKALLEYALRDSLHRKVTLVWGTNHDHDQYLRQHFEDLAQDHPRFDFKSVTGAPVSQAIGTLFDDFAGHRFFLAGPPDMIRATKSLLNDKGIAGHFIHHDPLPPSAGEEKTS